MSFRAESAESQPRISALASTRTGDYFEITQLLFRAESAESQPEPQRKAPGGSQEPQVSLPPPLFALALALTLALALLRCLRPLCLCALQLRDQQPLPSIPGGSMRTKRATVQWNTTDNKHLTHTHTREGLTTKAAASSKCSKGTYWAAGNGSVITPQLLLSLNFSFAVNAPPVAPVRRFVDTTLLTVNNCHRKSAPSSSGQSAQHPTQRMQFRLKRNVPNKSPQFGTSKRI